MALEASRAKNRFDEKWAHPEMIEENAYTMQSDQVSPILALKGQTQEQIERDRDNMRKPFYDMLKPTLPPFLQDYDEQWLKVEKGCPEEPDCAPIRVIVRTPRGGKPGRRYPAVFCVPAGGLVLGGTAEFNISSMVAAAGDLEDIPCVQVFSEYRLASEAPYPAALNDLHATYQWMVEHAEELRINTDRIVILGASAGGMLALSLGFRLKRYSWCGAPMPRGLVLQNPMMDDVAINDSYQYTLTSPDGEEMGWTTIPNELAMRAYLGDSFGDRFLSPEAVPNRATLDDIRGMPPMWFPTQAEFDPARDTVLAFVQLLYRADIYCELHLWGGSTHTVSFASQTPLGKRIRDAQGGALRDALTYDLRRL